MTSSEDEKADKASSFVDQKKGSKRSHLNVSDRADGRVGIAHAMRSSSNSAQTTDEKNVKKARWSASRDRQTHVITASLSMSDMNADARKERRIGAANSQRKATVLKPSAKNSVKKVSSVRKGKTMPNERSRAASREVESNDGGGVCCNQSASIRSPSSDEVEKTRGAEDDDEVSSTKSTLRPGCVPCRSKSSAVSSTQSRVNDDAALPEPVPPCTKCQGVELKSTLSATQSQTDACARLREQHSLASELPTGKPSTSSPIRTENPGQTDGSNVKMTKSESECELELDDCDDRQPPTIETPIEISEGTVLASSERPIIENPIQSESNSKPTERSAKNQKVKPPRSRSRSQKSNNSKVTSRDRTQSRDRKITKKNCTLMNWNQFKKIAKALSLSSKSNASHCQCDLSPEPSESQKEEKATIPPSSVLSKTSVKKSTSSSAACIPCTQSSKTSSHIEEAVPDNAAKIDHQPVTSVPSSIPCARKYNTTASTLSNQSKSRASLEKKGTCHMCKQEEIHEKAKLEVSRSQADSNGTNKPCPPATRKCWEENLKMKQGSTISKTKCVDSTSGPKTDRHPPTSQQCQPPPKCWTHTTKDKLGPSSFTEEKSTAPPSSCKIRCAMNKPTSISEKDKSMDDGTKVTQPSSPSSCRVYCPTNKTSRAEKNDEPLQESTEKSVSPTSPGPKCSIHGFTNKPTATSLSDIRTTTPPKGTKEGEHELKKSTSSTSEKLVSPSSSPKCWTQDKTNGPATEAKSNTEPAVTSPSKKCWMHNEQQKPILSNCARTQKVTNAAPNSSEGSFSTESPFPKCWKNTTDRPITAPPKTEKVQDSTEKSISPRSQKSRCVPQCKSHSTTGKTVSNASLETNKSEQVQSSNRNDSKHCPCDSYTTEKKPVAISSEVLRRCGASKSLEKYSTSTVQKCQPLPKCWVLETKEESIPTTSVEEPTSKSPNAQKKCEAVRRLPEKNILPTSQPKCWEPIKTSSPQKKCGTVKELLEKDTLSTSTLPKCQPLPKCWKIASTIPEVQKKYDTGKGLIDKSTPSMPQKCQPCSANGLKNEPISSPLKAPDKRSIERDISPTLLKCQPPPKCWTHNTKDEPTSTPTIAPKKCNTGRRSTEKSVSTTSQKCQVPKCWEYSKRDDEHSKPPVDKQTSTLSKTPKKCNIGRELSVKHIPPTMQKCQPLPKRWVLSTKEKSVSTSSKVSSKCKKFLKCQPLPKCWKDGTKDEPVSTSTVDEPDSKLTKTQKKCEASTGLPEKYISPTSPKCHPLPKCIERNEVSNPTSVTPASKECECKTENQLNNGASAISQKTESQCNPLSKCWTAEKPIQASTATDKSSSSTTSQVSTDLNKTQASKQKYSIEDICAKTSPTVSSRSDSTTSSGAQKDLCGLSCSRKVSATGRNSIQSVSTLSPNKRSNNNPCNQTCSEERPVSTKPTTAPLSLDQTTQDQKSNGMCPSFCYSQASKKSSTDDTNKYVSTSSPHSKTSSSKDVDPKHSSSGSMNTYKCTTSRTTHSSSSSVESTTKPKSTSQLSPSPGTANIQPSGICKPCHLSSMEEETTEPVVEKSTSSGASTTGTCGKPCNVQEVKGSTTETTSSGSYSTRPSCSSIPTSCSSSRSSNLSSSESKQTTSTSSEKFCQTCSDQKSIQHETSTSNSSTTVTPVSNESNSSNLCPAPCSTQLHKGQHQYNNTNTLVLENTTKEYPGMNNTCQPCQSQSDKVTPILAETLSKSNNETTCKPICFESTLQPPESTTQNQTSDSPRTNTACQPCQSQSHSDKSAPRSSPTQSDYQSTCKSIGPELTSQPPGNITENQTRSDNDTTRINKVSSSHSETASPECKECLRLRATPAPKCANCTKKSVPTKEENSTLGEKKSVGNASCPTICGGYPKPANADQSPASGTESKVSYETEVKNTQQEIDNMINEGPVVHPDSLKSSKEDSPLADCMYPTEIESRHVEDEPGICCSNKNGGPNLQCSVPTTTSIPTTTAPSKKENEVGSESTDLTDGETTNAADEEETDLADEEESSSSVQYTNVSCPPDYDSTSDEKDDSVTTSQPKKQATKQITQPSRRVLEKKPLKQAPRKLRKRTIEDADEKELSRGLKNQTVPKRSGQRRTDDRSETKMLYRTNRSSQYRQNAKKTVCGRRRYSSTDSEERTLRGQISFRSRPRIPVTLTHAVHLRRRHTDQSRERMLAELNKKKKHNTRFQ